ncbi:MAG: radical SAM family heme chaperone HemW [Planctomycetota bacterium]|jgi:oxygen-independent coproporphyrinogen-3 oxidase|nr:radical SAM family heme chaperone HemW [Planctomycetota bacterium]MDP6940950.1 radical SAM family heme chaperone HemW [Planctomycetota bacterium]
MAFRPNKSSPPPAKVNPGKATKNEAPNIAAERSALLSENGTSLYVHVPFCDSKCRYCDFNSWELKDSTILVTVVDALIKEAYERANGLQPQTVFIGGGTPSLLPPDLLEKLLNGLHEATGFRESSLETTLEANPESFCYKTAQAALGGGVTRASIGVQSLRSEVLRAYDRAHTPNGARDSFLFARKAGFQRINLDLIYSFPGQSLLEWFEDLAEVISWKPEHLSCYELAFEPGTPLSQAKETGNFPDKNPDAALRLFDETRTLCESSGYSAYEVSNFAKAGEECIHNLAGWRSLDCVGIGAGAVSWQAGIRRKNPANPDDWLESVLTCNTTAQIERPNPKTRLFDCFLMGLRLCDEGVSVSRALRQTGLNPKEVWSKELQEFFSENLLIEVGDCIRTTRKGLRLLDSILARLLPEESRGRSRPEKV